MEKTTLRKIDEDTEEIYTDSSAKSEEPENEHVISSPEIKLPQPDPPESMVSSSSGTPGKKGEDKKEEAAGVSGKSGERTKHSKADTREDGAPSRQLTPNIFENTKSKENTNSHSVRSSPRPTPIAQSERKS